MNVIIILFGKLLSKTINFLKLGSGATWPGHIALIINKSFVKEQIRNSNLKTILIAGTNGKTTTSKLIQTILQNSNKKVLLNESGANLLNGIASTLILSSNLLGKVKRDFAILEIDENTLPLALNELIPDYLVILNLFRDQLDRYGEVNTIASKWKKAIEKLPNKTKLILNADDPQVSYLGKNRKNSIYFGLNEKSSVSKAENWADSIFCPRCSKELEFEKIYFSHLGKWYCKSCGLKAPTTVIDELSYYPLSGMYNKYNTLAAFLTVKTIGIKDELALNALRKFNPAFGRQEEIVVYEKKVKIFLSKNPTGFNESLRTIKNSETILLVLNDRIPDGRDVSWIWDIDFENLLKARNVIVSGERAYDLALRIKYSGRISVVVENLSGAIKKALIETSKNKTLFILPTYSAMLETRKILTGRKIL